MTQKEINERIDKVETELFLLNMKNRYTTDDWNKERRLEYELKELKKMKADD